MEHDHLTAMLNRLKLTAVRDQLTAWSMKRHGAS